MLLIAPHTLTLASSMAANVTAETPFKQDLVLSPMVAARCLALQTPLRYAVDRMV